MSKIMQSSEGMIKFIRALELTIRIEGRIQKNFVSAFINYDNVPILCKKHYARIGHDRYYKHNQHYRESNIHDFTKCNGCF